MKTCTKCKVEKPTTEFHGDVQKRDGLKCWCKACCAKYWASDKGRAVHAKVQARYQASDKGRAVHAKASARYQASDKSRATKAKYNASLAGRRVNVRRYMRQKLERSIQRAEEMNR